VRNWKRRWFTLGEDGTLTYYGAAGETKPKGRVSPGRVLSYVRRYSTVPVALRRAGNA
jgi:hypothetical protein